MLALLLVAAGAPAAVWLDVPFVKQEKNGCGAAAIAMVVDYWHRNAAADARQIHHSLYSDAAKGVVADDMARYFQERGFEVFMFAGEWTDLGRHLSKGRPLIVALDSGRSHYVVVAGLDEQRDLVMLNDPARKKLAAMRRAEFEQQWKTTGNWTLLAVPRQVR